jgi:flagellar basal-body rod protein FlgG
MNISFYTSRTGMIAQQQGLNIYANNIANVNTVGFKPLRPSFAECIYTLQHHNRERWQTGHGQYLLKTDLMWSEASFVASDQPLDFALPNSDFFMVRDYRGEHYLTRDGAFEMMFTGEIWELVNANGDFVLDYDEQRIAIPFLPDVNGEPTTQVDYVALEQSIGVFTVLNNWGLDQAFGNRFAVTPRSGDAIPNYEADKVREALEMSATDLAGDMVRIIETQRSYQLNARILKVSDEIMTTVNNLR